MLPYAVESQTSKVIIYVHKSVIYAHFLDKDVSFIALPSLINRTKGCSPVNSEIGVL